MAKNMDMGAMLRAASANRKEELSAAKVSEQAVAVPEKSPRGRKPKYADGERITVTFATTKETKEKLRDIAYDNHMSVSDLITKWVNEYKGE